MGNLVFNLVCPCCQTKPQISHHQQIIYHEQNPMIKEDELIQPIQATQDNEYKSLNTVDPSLISNLDDLRLKPSNFVLLNKKHPSEVYKQIGEIGEGSYGSIIKVKHRLTHEIRAMKIIQKRRMAYGIDENKILEEIKILKSLDHPNIIKIYEFFVDKINFYIVMEYLDQGDLFALISKSRILKESVVCSIIKQIMSAIAYLHSKNIIHGDIKLENILIETIHREKTDKEYSTNNTHLTITSIHDNLDYNNKEVKEDRDSQNKENGNPSINNKIENGTNNVNNDDSKRNDTQDESSKDDEYDKLKDSKETNSKFTNIKDNNEKDNKKYIQIVEGEDKQKNNIYNTNYDPNDQFTSNHNEHIFSTLNDEVLKDYNSITDIEIKIIDFGCSKYFLPNEMKNDIVGTAYYVAPEVLNQEYNNKCDLWSVGVIMYTLLNGKPPFCGRSQSEILEKVNKGEYDLSSKRFDKVSKESKDLLVQLLKYNYKTRPSAYHALSHIWFNCEDWKTHTGKQFTTEIESVAEIYERLINFKANSKFEQAVLTIIAHNISESPEAKRLKKIFLMFDEDSDGRISPEDLKHTILCLNKNTNRTSIINKNSSKSNNNSMSTLKKSNSNVNNKNSYFKRKNTQTEQINSNINIVNNNDTNTSTNTNNTSTNNNNNLNASTNTNKESIKKMNTSPIDEISIDNGKDINSIISDIMKNVDYDKNGLIEFEEFLKATIDKQQLTSDSNLVLAFSIFFLGDNGNSNLKTKSIKEKKITYKEIHRTIFGESSTKTNLTKDILEELGKSLNDEIGFEEFKSIIVK